MQIKDTYFENIGTASIKSSCYTSLDSTYKPNSKNINNTFKFVNYEKIMLFFNKL